MMLTGIKETTPCIMPHFIGSLQSASDQQISHFVTRPYVIFKYNNYSCDQICNNENLLTVQIPPSCCVLTITEIVCENIMF